MYSVVLMVALTGGADSPAFGHRGGCNGCSGGCYGGCYGGCTGGCYGGCAGSCTGSCNGGKHHGRRMRHRRGHGCHGGCNGGCCGGYAGCTGGCCGGYAGCTGGCTGGVIVNPPPVTDDRERVSAPATIVVKLPADAKLTIDGAATSSTSSERVFATPALTSGQDYFYTFKAMVVREGRPIAAEQQVRVRAGQKTPVTFDFATTAVVQK